MIGKTLLFGILSVVFVPPFITLWDMDWNSHFHKHYPGKCRPVKQSGIGSEDFQILSSGLTFITSGLSVSIWSPESKAFAESKGNGSIQLIDLNRPTSKTEQLKILHGPDFNQSTFRPHGLSVLEDKVKGEHLLYVINHVEDQADRVEKFRFNPETRELRHEKTIFSDRFRIINDLTVLSEDKVYVSNNFYFNTSRIMLTLEQLYRPKLGAVLYYNGSDVTKIVPELFSPNGVILSKDRRYLYVSLGNLKAVQVYKISNEPNHDLKLLQEIKVHTGLDNFHLSENGDSLFGGCHPIFHKIATYLADPGNHKSPSQVIRLPLKNGLIVENDITQVFYDHGDLLSGSSVAGVFKKKMLIGSVTDSLIICDISS